ncbi:MAG: ABC transporter permease [Vicingaceae bacterium]|nr:ABC transporter permease [Vicingaceae bacterium]
MTSTTPYTTKVDASDNALALNLKELFRYKDLFWVLAYRDLRVRYAQTFLGLLWALIQPLTTLIIVSVVFGRFVKVETGGVPYPVFAVIGISLWTYFSFVLSQSGGSVIGAQEMVKKIYFPRLVIPLSKAVVGFVDFGVALLLLIGLFFYYRIIPSSNIVFLPLFLILTIISSLAVGIWLSALTIRYRDFQYVVPFFVQFGLYLTPIAYPTDIVVSNLPNWATFLFYLNPMAGIVEGFRWSLLGGTAPMGYFWISIVFVFILFISGLYYFRKIERVMADII